MTSYSFHRVITLAFLTPLFCRSSLFYFSIFSTLLYLQLQLRTTTNFRELQPLPRALTSTITHIYTMRPSPYLFPRLTPLFRHAPTYPPVIVHTTSAGTPTQTASETDQATASWWVTHIHQNTIPTLVRILYHYLLFLVVYVLTSGGSVFQ